MKIIIEADNIDKEKEMIEAYIRYNLKMLKINKVEIEQGEKTNEKEHGDLREDKSKS